MSARWQHLAVAVALVTAAGCSSSSRSRTTVAGLDRADSIETDQASSLSASIAIVDPIEVAVRYVASTDSLMAHSPIGRREIFRQLVTPTALDGQVEAFSEAADRMGASLDVPVERLVWVEAPITAALVASDDLSASVAVWTVSILGSLDGGSPQQVWRTVHVDLELFDGEWLVGSASADAGPTPAPNELALQSGWSDFEVVANWRPVVEGVELQGGGG